MTSRWIDWTRCFAPWAAVGVLHFAEAAPAIAQTPVPEGSEFQVNTHTTGAQNYPAVAAAADGDFVVVWEDLDSTPPDVTLHDIFGQRYASNGSAQGAEFQINTFTTNRQIRPTVATSAGGDFVVTWSSLESSGTDTSSYSIHARRFASDGSGQGAQFQVNTYTTDLQFDPFVAAAADGDFVVVWWSAGSPGTDTDAASVQGQRYASDGTAQGAQFQVNSYTTQIQSQPSVAAAAGGEFVVVWQSGGSYGTDSGPGGGSIQGQRYASDGSTQGVQFQVNTYTTSSQYNPCVTVSADGSFGVVWVSVGSSESDTGSSRSIQGQRYASDGSALGAQFQVNTYTTNDQKAPSVAATADGTFVVAWASNGSSGTDTIHWSVQGQRYASNGLAVGEQFQINTYTTSFQDWPVLAGTVDGDFVVVWHTNGSSGTDSFGRSVQGQRYIAPSAVGVPALSPSMSLALGAVLLLLGAAVARAYGSASRRSRFSR